MPIQFRSSLCYQGDFYVNHEIYFGYGHICTFYSSFCTIGFVPNFAGKKEVKAQTPTATSTEQTAQDAAALAKDAA
ncbi:hypothetical protein [Acinetobacter sp. ANC 4173]|uniref:hypothetical protein n=1 Tax=Acinetobacter sp. ANC 4173 TaxID=2529837 RepID=UPI00103E2458|nr:hypothetical protein [Acinetobacter sp. ANC 4173]TCB82129.1 hypothetical protein E0H94_00520 [Acinetobacter sp. ANC 4173]